MKINPGWRPFGKDLKVGEIPVQPSISPRSFSDTLRDRDQRASQQELQLMLEQIQIQADRLSKSMTVRELRLYKQMVKRFLEETARRGVGLKDTRGWDRRGRSKRYKLLEEVDSVLLTMADEMLVSEEGRIDLLRKVGEVRGLLINLSF